MRIKKAGVVCTTLLALLCLLSFQAAAGHAPYQGYIYDSWNETAASPNGYEATWVLNGEQMGAGRLDSPSDLFRQGEYTYIADTGNNRIVVLDAAFRCVRILDTFIDQQGNSTTLNRPQGVFATAEGLLLIADTDNKRVILCREDGSNASFLKKPEEGIYPDNIEFLPLRVIRDSVGNIYVLVKDFYYGAVSFAPNGAFNGFFGSNQVEVTAEVLLSRFWKQFMSNQQRDYLSDFVPVSYSSFDIDGEDAVYTCTDITTSSLDEIKKVNSSGINILRVEENVGTYQKNDYGDKERLEYRGKWIDTRFIDIQVTDSGLINALDSTQGRIFQYDQESNLLTIFGGLGSQKGLFRRPVALESVGNSLLVLDADNGTLTLFEETAFGKAVHMADALFSKGLYRQSVEPWQEVLRLDANYGLAYQGIGKALAQEGKYQEALWYFRQGYDREGYSQAFSVVRTQVLRQWFPVIGSVAILLVLALLYGRRIAASIRRRKGIPAPVHSGETPLYVMCHPLNGYDNIRRTNRFSLFIGAVLLGVLWFFASILEYEATGFIFNLNQPASLDLLLMLLKTIGVLFLWVTCNWAVTTLLGGEGNFRRIFVVSAYALTPYIFSILLKTLLSNIITREEATLVNLLVWAGILWSVFLMAIAIKEVHQFSGCMTAVSILLTILGMMLSLFILLLAFSLVQQIVTFIQTIFSELMSRGG